MDSQNDHDRGPELLAILWTFTSLAILFVGLRIFVRIRLIRETGLDDGLVLLSAVGLWHYSSCTSRPDHVCR